jgi:putative tryptophan/tyrosine transport system substrate-binding protein
LISSLAQPGGNITGFASQAVALGAKRLELLKQIAPHVTRVACISDPSTPTWPGFFAEVETAAPSLGLIVSADPIRDAADIEATIDAFAHEPNGGPTIPGHCAGKRFYDMVRAEMPNKVVRSAVGTRFVFGT